MARREGWRDDVRGLSFGHARRAVRDLSQGAPVNVQIGAWSLAGIAAAILSERPLLLIFLDGLLGISLAALTAAAVMGAWFALERLEVRR